MAVDAPRMKQALSRRRFLAGVGASAAVAATADPAAAGATDATAPTPATQSAVESTLDELVPASLDEHGVPGAAVAVVDADEVTTKGYGVADTDSEAPVDPEATAFRVGSVSKSVTATALMDRVQRGEIDPEAPVSAYVDDSTLAELLSPAGSVAARDSQGGPATSAVEDSLTRLRDTHADHTAAVDAHREALAAAEDRLAAEVADYV